MSDVDISPDVVERAAKMIEGMPEVDVALLDHQEVEVSALLRALSAALTATQEKLAAAQAQIEAARNEGLKVALAAIVARRREYQSDSVDSFVSELYTDIEAILALKSTPPAPVRDDERDVRLMRHTINAFYPDFQPVDLWVQTELAKFNTQEKP